LAEKPQKLLALIFRTGTHAKTRQKAEAKSRKFNVKQVFTFGVSLNSFFVWVGTCVCICSL